MHEIERFGEIYPCIISLLLRKCPRLFHTTSKIRLLKEAHGRERKKFEEGVGTNEFLRENSLTLKNGRMCYMRGKKGDISGLYALF